VKCFDSCENLLACNVSEGDDDDEDCSLALIDKPPKLTEAFEMMHKLHLLVTIQHSQLHQLIDKLESKLIDVYIDSTERRQATINDF
jgi:hypothetical protein